MRGFRGSRNALNAFQSRFGRGQGHHDHPNSRDPKSHPHDHQTAQRVLPEWMKTPETKAREAALAVEQDKAPVVAQTQPQPKAQPKLVLVPTQASAAKTKANSKPKPTPATVRTASTRSKAVKASTSRKRTTAVKKKAVVTRKKAA